MSRAPSLPAKLKPYVWPAIFVVLAVAAYVVLRHKRDLVDFAVYRTAAQRALHAEPLYRPEDGHYQYKYLPAFALLMAPFAWLPAEASRAVWFAASIAALALFIRLSLLALPDRRRSLRWLTWVTLLLVGKCYAKELILGQTNALLGLMLVGAVVAVERGRRMAAGTLVGVAVFVKPYAVLLLPWLAVSVGWPAVAAFCGVSAAGLAMPALAYGWHGNLDLLVGWYRTVTDTTAPNLTFPENVSIGAMWAKWLGPSVTASALAATTGVAALAASFGPTVARRGVRRPHYLAVGSLMLVIPLLSPQGWDYVLLLATPAVVCLIDRVGDVPLSWRIVTVAALAVIAFTIFDLLGRRTYEWLMAGSIETVAGLVLVAAVLHLRWRSLA